MSEFSAFFDNSVLFWSLLSCLIAQFLKIIFNSFQQERLDLELCLKQGACPQVIHL